MEESGLRRRDHIQPDWDLATADFGDANVIRKFGQGGKGRYERLLFRRCRPILARDPGPVR
jgi:hypothetical protein